MSCNLQLPKIAIKFKLCNAYTLILDSLRIPQFNGYSYVMTHCKEYNFLDKKSDKIYFIFILGGSLASLVLV